MATRTALALLAALLTAATWVVPSGGALGLRPNVTADRIVPSVADLKPVPAAQLFRSTPQSARVARPILPARAPAKTATRISSDNNLDAGGTSAQSNGANHLYPTPDASAAIGPADYVEMANSVFAVWARSDLNVNRAYVSLAHFLGDPNADPFCNPQVQWDPTAGRWLYAFRFCDPASTTHAQAFFFGWSKTSDPSMTSGWCNFAVTNPGHEFDYIKLGHSSKYLIFGGNFRTTPTPSQPFETAGIGWTQKPANGAISTCVSPPAFFHTTGTALNPLKNADGITNAFTPVPVNTITGSTDGYIVAAYDPSGDNGQPAVTPRNKLAVWRLDSAGVLHQGSDITVPNFAVSMPAPQLGNNVPLDTLDARITQAVGDPVNGIWFSHTVDGGVGGRSVVRWYEVKAAGPVTSLTQHGDISDSTDWIFNGAISPRLDHLGAAVFYNRSSATIYPRVHGQVRLSSTAPGAMEAGELTMGSGSAGETDAVCSTTCPWGSYSAASPDPVQTNLVWGTNEYTADTGNGPNFPNWYDVNFAVSSVGKASGVIATAGDMSARVLWSPPPFDPGTPITGYKVQVFSNGTGTVVQTLQVPATPTSIMVTGLTNGVTYVMFVFADVFGGESSQAATSNAVVPTRGAVGSSRPPLPARDSPLQSTPRPPPTGR